MKFVMQGPIKRQNYPKGKRYNEHMFDLEFKFESNEQLIEYTQRFANKTYAGEYLCFGGVNLSGKGPGKRIESLQDAYDIAHGLGVINVSFRWKNSNLGSRSTYYYGTKTIVLGKQATHWIVLHELAHHLSPQRGHTNLFRGTYLRLVRMYCGDVWFDRLKRCFTEVGIGYEFPAYRGK